MSSTISLKFDNGIYSGQVFFDTGTKKTKAKLKKNDEKIDCQSIQVGYKYGKKCLSLEKIKINFEKLVFKDVVVEKNLYKIRLVKKQSTPLIKINTGCFVIEDLTDTKPKFEAIKLTCEEFRNRHSQAIEITEDESDGSNFETITDLNQSITSFDMSDCITVFALEKTEATISKIMGYHIRSDTDDEEFEEGFSALGIKKKRHYDIVIIGGTEESEKLLESIHKHLPLFFENYTIINVFYNLLKGSDFDYISANMNGEGLLTYCQHKNPL